MLYSYRHPDLAATVTVGADLINVSEHGTVGLEERRRFVRLIPVAAVVHSNDADAWSLWDQAVEGTSQ